MGKYIINKSFETQVTCTDRVLEVAEAFGLGLDDKKFVLYDNLELEVRDGDVVYINGQSGSGKSVLLQELQKEMEKAGKKVLNINSVIIDKDKPVIDQIGSNMHEAINLLSKTGINDAYLLIRKPCELSDGQRYRLWLAKLIENDADVWVADEFGAVLDRITAKVVAFNIQKVARRLGKTLIVATTHTDLLEELGPDLEIYKTYQDKVVINERNRDKAE